MAKTSKPAVTPVASQTFFNIHIDKTYRIIDPVIKAKSPREKEKSMIKEKQQTMAGPKSPNIKNNKIATTIAINANEKNDQRFCQLLYSEINFSLEEKKPARKKNDQELYYLAGLKAEQINLYTTPFRSCTKNNSKQQ